MKYVYVLMCGFVGDYGIKDIYTSKKKAEEAEQELKAKSAKSYQGEIWIEQWEVK